MPNGDAITTIGPEGAIVNGVGSGIAAAGNDNAILAAGTDGITRCSANSLATFRRDIFGRGALAPDPAAATQAAAAARSQGRPERRIVQQAGTITLRTKISGRREQCPLRTP